MKLKTKYPFSKVLLAGTSLLAFAGLTGFVASNNPLASSSTTTSAATVERSIVTSDDGGRVTTIRVPQSGAVTQTRGT